MKDRILTILSAILSDRYGVRIEVSWQRSK